MLTFIAFLSLLAWLWLTFLQGNFWRASERLTDAPEPENWPEVVAVIPARNEAETIGAVISAHVAADYPGRFSVIVADDGSTDGTATIAAAAGDSDRLEIVSVPDLPNGWSGKLWAIHNGLMQASKLSPEAKYVLLTDADIQLSPDTLTRLVAKAEKEKLALTSLMAKLDSRGPWASFLIPAFIYFFQKLYPFPRANDPDDNLAAAAGGCMLVRRDAIEAIGGIERIKGALIDDCTFAKAIKDITPSTRIWLGIADSEAVSLRDNRELSSIWNMVARTAYAQLGYSPLLLFGTVMGMALVYLAAPLVLLTIFFHWNFSALFYALITCGLMAYTYWPTLRLYGRAPWEAVLLPAAGALYTAMTVSSAMRYWRGEGGQWKGRTYS
ncbi:glycosyltransferase [Hyphococcus flavus]|uniref:Glycosyltransferase n=1 Tax=Hyphococcus flavus TaxID=1866326 RepID=A0AAE9ZE01_9PROT|nr:glycosyltransferase [Hyphococcus flavus]WDI30903.1 glycosyltransferase [Hyphococcus flavus]